MELRRIRERPIGRNDGGISCHFAYRRPGFREAPSGLRLLRLLDIVLDVVKAIFKENAQQYRQIMKLADNDKTRETMYAAEVLGFVPHPSLPRFYIVTVT